METIILFLLLFDLVCIGLFLTQYVLRTIFIVTPFDFFLIKRDAPHLTSERLIHYLQRAKNLERESFRQNHLMARNRLEKLESILEKELVKRHEEAKISP